jgi:hypothetical protein
MFIDKDGKRIRPDGVITHGGTTFNANVLLYPEVVEDLGITEIADPVPPPDYTPDTYDRTEIDDAPYVIYTPHTAEIVFARLAVNYETALDLHLDNVAREHRYNNRFTFALRAGYPGPFYAEGVAFAQWMDNVNAQAYALMEAVKAGQVPPPTIGEFLAGLPVFVKP